MPQLVSQARFVIELRMTHTAMLSCVDVTLGFTAEGKFYLLLKMKGVQHRPCKESIFRASIKSTRFLSLWK